MAHVVGKKINGEVYYYLREMARVNGKPKVVRQQYLGKAEDIAAAVAGSGSGGVEPERCRNRAFGDVAAVWGMLERLGVAQIIDDVVGSRRSDAAASVGTYLALATLNRVVDPCSKLAFADWWATTAGDRLVTLPAGATDHRRFWDAMDALDTAALDEVQRRITARIVDEFGLSLSGLALDMTNFATFIDSQNTRAPIAQRGHAKQKRTDLRIVGLGLVVTREDAIPVAWHPYAGNAPDVTQFATLIDELHTRYLHTTTNGNGNSDSDSDSGATEMTVVFDAGQNSEANFAHLRESGLHYVGSLPPGDYTDLLAINRRGYRRVDPARFPGLTAYPTRVHALGADRRVVLTHSRTLHEAQSRGLDQTLAKTTRALDELAATLARGRTRRDRAAVEKVIENITKPRWIRRILTTTLTGHKPAQLRLTYHLNHTARAALESEQFGKRILVTDHEHWPVTDIVAAYRSQNDAEQSFRQLKNPAIIGFSPMHHWTDQKIRVHTFYCVLALAVAHLMRRQAAHAGLHLSVREILQHLNRIQETTLLYPSTGGRPRARHMLTERDPTQNQLYDLFNLHHHAP